MGRALLVVLVVCAAARSAHAESSEMSLGDLLKTATRVEVVVVIATTTVAFTGIVVAPIRSSSQLGATIELWDPGVKIGDRALVVCDRQMCPRTFGVERDGLFRLTTLSNDDPVSVSPRLVEATSLVALAAGAPAPDLCVTGEIALLDDDARPVVAVAMHAADGDGIGTIAGHPVTAWLFPTRFAAIALHVAAQAAPAELELITDRLVRGPDGCYAATWLPAEPVARTPRSLERALAGRHTAMTIATGTLVIARGGPAAGRHAVTFSVTAAGVLQLASDLGGGPLGSSGGAGGQLSLEFPSALETGHTDELAFSFPVPNLTDDGTGAGAALARAVHDHAIADVAWSRRGRGKPTALGALTLTYVAEPKPR